MAESEMRIWMMGELSEMCVGLPEIEEFGINLETIPKKINLHLKVKPSLSQDLSMEKISGSAPANQRPALGQNGG